MRKILLFGVSILSAAWAYSQSIPSYLLENNAAHRFLTEVSYSSDDYTYTKITDYCDPVPYQYYKYGGYRKDQPLPVPLRWTAAADVVSQKIELSEDETFSNPVIYNVSKDASSYDIYNLIPGRTYYYKVLATKSDHSTVQIDSAAFRTEGTLRMLKIDSVFNVRDMGGWIGLGGKPIKYGKLIRGSRLNINGSSKKIITEEGIQELRNAGIKAELDLRDAGDAANASYSFLGRDIPIVNINGAYNSRIATFAKGPQSIEGIKQIIAWFKEDKPVYFHCSVGADRTGTVAYLIGALCGMSEDALCKEFELTSFSADSIVTSGRQEDLRRRRTYDGRFDDNDNPDSYKFANMVDQIKQFPGATLQRKVYNHLRQGVNGKSISEDDLAFLVKYLVDYSLLAKVDADVDTLRLESGQTHKLELTFTPADAEVSEITYKTSSSMIATVSEDGVVTAVGGGKAIITVSVDGITKTIPVIVPVTQESVVNLCLENELVHKFMTRVHYDDVDYSVSYIEDYVSQAASYTKDWPSPARIEWNRDPELIRQYLTVSTDDDFEDITYSTETNLKSNYWDVKNLDPQKFYYYSLSSTYSDMTTVESLSSAFLTTGSVKMIRTDGTFNVRDLGGWTGQDGHMIRYGKILRGARLKNNQTQGGQIMITTDDIDIIRQYVGAELDLRSDEETPSTTSALGRRAVKFKRIASANTCLGDKILEGDAYIEAMEAIIGWLKDDGVGVYISSSLGADRVGTLAFLINGLLGVSESDLAKDYELSSFSTDTLENVVRKRSDSQYTGMVNKIKTLAGETLQQKIFNYFKNGVNGTKISEDDLNWFIGYMIDTNPRITKVSAAPKDKVIDNRIYNLFGQEVTNPGKGIYIRNGKKFIVK